MKTLVGVASLAVVAVVVVLVGFGRASSPLAVAVADAATRCPDGFTVTVHGLAGGAQPTSSLSASCVLDLGIPAGTAGATGAAGTPGTTGPPGLSGYTLKATSVKSGKSNADNRVRGQELVAVAMCPAGKTAIGGGARTSVKSGKSNTSDRFAITTSEPTADGHGWVVETANLNFSKSNINRSSDPTATLTVTAICVAMP